MDDIQPFDTIAVIGGGAWGTALAHLCASNGASVKLWAREQSVVDAINIGHENTVYLPGVALNPGLEATHDLTMACRAQAIIFVVPAQYARATLIELKAVTVANTPIALCSKGIEQTTGLLMTQTLEQVWPEAPPAVLSGPSFARDVAKGLPTAVTIACASKALGHRWVATIGAPHFRPYLSTDLLGAELGGAVKNVLAIAAGVVDGRGFGESARAALIARGFAEFQRLGVAMGAQPQTMAGLSGLGDLILTASSPQSRNMSLGLELGKGRSLSEIMAERNTVSEGVATAAAVRSLAKNYDVDMPICSAVAELVSGAKTTDQIITDLLARPFKTEAK